MAAQKWKFSKLIFLYILTIQNDQISYVKHFLAPLYLFFTLFGCWGGGTPKGGRGTTCLCSFPASAAQEWLSLSPLRGALPKAIEFSSGFLVTAAVLVLQLCGAPPPPIRGYRHFMTPPPPPPIWRGPAWHYGGGLQGVGWLSIRHFIPPSMDRQGSSGACAPCAHARVSTACSWVSQLCRAVRQENACWGRANDDCAHESVCLLGPLPCPVRPGARHDDNTCTASVLRAGRVHVSSQICGT